jgi:hypothetical protein
METTNHTPTPIDILKEEIALNKKYDKIGVFRERPDLTMVCDAVVNSHEAMKEALDSAYALLSEFSQLASWQDSDNKVLEEIEKAIIQAEGK